MPRLLPTLGVVVTLALGFLAPTLAEAAPIDDEIQLLRARPTGMEEAEWRRQRREVARELGETRNPKAVEALIEVVETERYDAVLSIAIEGLGKQGDPQALPALQKVYADRSFDTFVRDQAATAIKALGGTPRDDARLTGEVEGSSGTSEEGLVSGTQLGTMGAASAPDDALPTPKRKKPLPDNLRARDRAFGLAVGSLDLRINTLDANQPISADAGLGVNARYVDDRHGWGWSANGVLSGSIVNGDHVPTPNPNPGNDGDVGNSLWIREAVAGSAEAHVYFKQTDWHAFIGLGLSQRLNVLQVGGDGDPGNGDEEQLSDTRFALDVVPAAGLGWGRYLNAGADLMVDAIITTLKAENILARPIDEPGRKAIQYAVFSFANDRASYPRMAAALAVLREKGYLARSPSPRLIYRLIRIMDDPSYVERMEGPRVRVGFLFGFPIGQSGYLGPFGNQVTDTAQAGPFLQLDYGVQLDREREIQIDTRVFYDAMFDITGYTTDSGAMYRRNLHGKYDDYFGAWYVGLRGGVSKRVDTTLPSDAPNEAPGYRGLLQAGYAYKFNRGSSIDVGAQAGVDSGAFVVGAGLGFTFGIAHANVLNPGARVSVGSNVGRNKGRFGAGGGTKAGGKGEAEAGSGSGSGSGSGKVGLEAEGSASSDGD
jgi:hypothetical protein